MIYAQVFENGEIQIFESTVSDSVRYETIKFGFPPKWNDYTKTAVFTNNENTISVILNAGGVLCTGEDECYIPHEVIKSPRFTVSVFGVSGESRVTTSKAVIRVIKSGYSEGDEPSVPTPTEYQQLVNLAKETKELARSVRNDADNGVFNGEKGKDGYTPILGVDYVTIDQSTEYVFDGGNADQSVPTVMMVDDTLSENSINAIMNKTVAKKFSGLDSDLSGLKNRVYIAESGYSGGWNYRKFSDGMVILWGTIPETGANMTVKNNGIYQSATRSIALPFAVANAVCTGQVSNGVLLTNAWASTDDSNLNYTIGHIEPKESQDCTVRIFVIGKWK